MKLIGILLSLAFLSLPVFAESEIIPKTEEGAFGEKVLNFIKATDLDSIKKLMLPESEYPRLFEMLKIPADQHATFTAEGLAQQTAEHDKLKDRIEGHQERHVVFKDLKIISFKAEEVDRAELPIPDHVKAIEYRIHTQYTTKYNQIVNVHITIDAVKLDKWYILEVGISG
jgi:hypothetical protein